MASPVPCAGDFDKTTRKAAEGRRSRLALEAALSHLAVLQRCQGELREHGVAHVFNSWTRMPSIGEQLALQDSVTGPFVICRALLRPGRTYEDAVEAFSPYDRIQDEQPELRADLVALIRTALALRLPAYVIANNRAEGSAPLTIIAVARMLLESGEE